MQLACPPYPLPLLAGPIPNVAFGAPSMREGRQKTKGVGNVVFNQPTPTWPSLGMIPNWGQPPSLPTRAQACAWALQAALAHLGRPQTVRDRAEAAANSSRVLKGLLNMDVRCPLEAGLNVEGEDRELLRRDVDKGEIALLPGPALLMLWQCGARQK